RHTRCLSDWSSDVCSSDLGSEKLLVRSGTGKLIELLHGLPVGMRERVRLALFITGIARLTEIRGVIDRLVDAGVCRLITAEGARSEERRVGKECGGGGWAC